MPRTRAVRKYRRAATGVGSLLLHLAALASLTALGTRALAPVPDESAVEIVFQPIAASPEPPTPEPSTPEPAPPEPAPPEPAPPEPAPPALPPPEPPSIEQPAPPPAPAPPKPKPVPPRPAPTHAPAPPRAPSPQTPIAPAPPPLAAPAAPAPIVDPSWQSGVAAWLETHKSYPEAALRRGEEGRVVVRITVVRSGQVLEAAVVGPSGSDRLDAATLTMLRGASLPAFPASMPQARVTVITAVRFTLR